MKKFAGWKLGFLAVALGMHAQRLLLICGAAVLLTAPSAVAQITGSVPVTLGLLNAKLDRLAPVNAKLDALAPVNAKLDVLAPAVADIAGAVDGLEERLKEATAERTTISTAMVENDPLDPRFVFCIVTNTGITTVNVEILMIGDNSPERSSFEIRNLAIGTAQVELEGGESYRLYPEYDQTNWITGWCQFKSTATSQLRASIQISGTLTSTALISEAR